MKNILLIFYILLMQVAVAQEDSIEVFVVDTNHYYAGFFIQIQSSPYFSNNFYAQTDTRDYADPIDVESMYTEYSGYMIGLNFSYTSKDWLVTSGLHFSKHSSLFHITEQKEQIVNGEPGMVEVDTSYINKYQHIHLPIGFGYVNNMGQWVLTIKAGLNLSVNILNNGYTYDFSKKEIILLKDNLSPLIVSYSLSANLKYQVSERIRVLIEPYYISGINSLWSDSPIYAWKQVHYGLGFGIEFLIHNNNVPVL